MIKKTILIIFTVLFSLSLVYSADPIIKKDGSDLLSVIQGGNSLTNICVADGSVPFTGDVDFGDNALLNANLGGIRPLNSENKENVTVCSSGCDYSSIQNAVNDIPLYLKDRITIDVQNGNYDEHVLIPPTIQFDNDKNPPRTTQAITILGNETNPEEVKVDSFFILDSGNGGSTSPQIQGFMMTNTSVYSDDGYSIQFYGTNGRAQDIVFENNADLQHGIMAYGAINIQSTDINITNTDKGIAAKGGGFMNARNITGTANTYAFDSASNGHISVRGSTTATGLTDKYRIGPGAIIYDRDNDEYFVPNADLKMQGNNIDNVSNYFFNDDDSRIVKSSSSTAQIIIDGNNDEAGTSFKLKQDGTGSGAEVLVADTNSDIKINNKLGVSTNPGTDALTVGGNAQVNGDLTSSQKVTGKVVSINSGVDQTISSDTIAFTQSYTSLVGEGGSADNLSCITGGEEGDLLYMKAIDDVTINELDGSCASNDDKILLDSGSTFTLNHPRDEVRCYKTDNSGGGNSREWSCITVDMQ